MNVESQFDRAHQSIKDLQALAMIPLMREPVADCGNNPEVVFTKTAMSKKKVN